MKCVLLSLATLFLVAALANSYPAELTQQQLELDEPQWELPSGEIIEKHVFRLKRDHLCGLFDPGSWNNNHVACNNHCRIKGNRGGHCAGTTCQCT
uniref:Defensin 1 n=1 Tax=Triatoma infestans TaxID=30076 RepID=A0A171AHY7_TRIIF